MRERMGREWVIPRRHVHQILMQNPFEKTRIRKKHKKTSTKNQKSGQDATPRFLSSGL